MKGVESAERVRKERAKGREGGRGGEGSNELEKGKREVVGREKWDVNVEGLKERELGEGEDNRKGRGLLD